MVTKTFRIGLPTVPGNYFILTRGSRSARLVKAVDLSGVVKTFDEGKELIAADDMLHYGPVPDAERSLSSGARKPIVAQAS